MLKRVLVVLSVIITFSLPVFSQAAWFDGQTNSVNGRNVIVVPSAKISVCTHPANAVPCTNLITTYTSASLSNQCPSTSQLIAPKATACGGYSDAQGNFGFWAAGGTYDY